MTFPSGCLLRVNVPGHCIGGQVGLANRRRRTGSSMKVRGSPGRWGVNRGEGTKTFETLKRLSAQYEK